MSSVADRERVLEQVEARGLFQNSVRVPRGSGEPSVALQGDVIIGGRKITLRVVLPPHFPLSLPEFYLQARHTVGPLPHVDERGVVCFADREGLLIDRRRPEDVVEDALTRVLAVLEAGICGRNASDFANEFENYWRRLSTAEDVRSVLDPIDSLRWAVVATSRDDGVFVASSEEDLTSFRNGESAGDGVTVRRALYLPLAADTVIVPPGPSEEFWTPRRAREILVGGLSPEDRARLGGMLKRRARQREYVVAGLPRPAGGRSLFGLRFDGVGKRHPLVEGGTADQVCPLRLARLDRSYLVERGGGDGRLKEKRVLLVGCGAVGGALAMELARSGVGRLTLLDCDRLSADNTFRHVLGRGSWGQNKVEALKAEIEAQLPYVRVFAIPLDLETALGSGEVDFTGYDLVLFATGNPTVELDANERIHSSPPGTAALFTWLEPLSIGGHALLVRNAEDGGCFECLFTSPAVDDGPLQNRAAFAAPGQSFGKDLSGCGGLHTPYGWVDAVQTAALAGRLAIDALTGRERGNPLLSWKGDARAFEAAGYQLSPRYRAPDLRPRLGHLEYRSPRCPVCGPRQSRSIRLEADECRAA